VYTTWKRAYVEVDRMFRKGAYITESIKAGHDYIFVSDLAPFRSGDVVRLIHAPPLEAQSASNGLSPLPITDFFYSEDHTIDVVPTPTVLPDGSIRQPHLKLRAGETLEAPFGVDWSFVEKKPNATPLPYLRDAVGVVSTGFYEADLTMIGSAYQAMYIEMIQVQGAVAEMPFAASMSAFLQTQLGNKWFEHCRRTPSANVVPEPNHAQIVGASEVPDIPNPITQTPGAELGITAVGTGHFRSWVWVGRVERAVCSRYNRSFN
jgi:hypothetical protein